ncbi:M24 family metallopeptidase [Deferrisoma camini]|uniref:M24 family metallopeptidase n=1 Tax=Deferrisoma camini TaxID=1035120 RepID=UPI000A0390B7|nr:Xaa-Pro peptidase family protein [Deferrisoma camini]
MTRVPNPPTYHPGPAAQPVPAEEIRGRIERFRRALRDRGVAGALLTHRPDRFYLAGTTQEGFLWIPSAGEPELWILRDPTRAARESPVRVVPVGSGRDLWQRTARAVGEGAVGIAADVMPAAWLGRLGSDRWEDVAPDLLGLRRRKTPWERERMAGVGRTVARVYEYGAARLRPGVTEAVFAAELFAEAVRWGHEGRLWSRGTFEAYPWHVVAGPNTLAAGAVDTPMPGVGRSPAFPVGASDRPIHEAEPVVVDFGISVGGYQTDQTRTFCLGPAPAWLADLHRALLDVHRTAAALLRPGVQAGEVFEAALRRAEALGIEGYLGPPERRCRFVGHGVGIETVEPPLIAEGSREVLAEGDTIALEPKAVVPGLGGAGVEDTFLVTADGPVRLTPMPQELWGVERGPTTGDP